MPEPVRRRDAAMHQVPLPSSRDPRNTVCDARSGSSVWSRRGDCARSTRLARRAACRFGGGRTRVACRRSQRCLTLNLLFPTMPRQHCIVNFPSSVATRTLMPSKPCTDSVPGRPTGLLRVWLSPGFMPPDRQHPSLWPRTRPVSASRAFAAGACGDTSPQSTTRSRA